MAHEDNEGSVDEGRTKKKKNSRNKKEQQGLGTPSQTIYRPVNLLETKHLTPRRRH